jgi:hypothetical protein
VALALVVVVVVVVVVVSSIMLIARVLVLLMVPVGIQSLNPPSCPDSSTDRDGGSWFLVSSHRRNLLTNHCRWWNWR